MSSIAHRGQSRTNGEAVDPAPLAEPITLPFSKRTALNRFLKAPMAERLCHWDNDDIVGY